MNIHIKNLKNSHLLASLYIFISPFKLQISSSNCSFHKRVKKGIVSTIHRPRAFRVKNAVMQVKNECVHHRNDKTIELFYNQRIILKGLNFKTLNQIVKGFYSLAA